VRREWARPPATGGAAAQQSRGGEALLRELHARAQELRAVGVSGTACVVCAASARADELRAGVGSGRGMGEGGWRAALALPCPCWRGDGQPGALRAPISQALRRTLDSARASHASAPPTACLAQQERRAHHASPGSAGCSWLACLSASFSTCSSEAAHTKIPRRCSCPAGAVWRLAAPRLAAAPARCSRASTRHGDAAPAAARATAASGVCVKKESCGRTILSGRQSDGRAHARRHCQECRRRCCGEAPADAAEGQQR
jgi:hypothetical protein